MNKPQIMTGVNIFVDGFGHLGTSKTVTLPKITEGAVENSVGGLTREIATGTLEKLECSFTLQEYSAAVFAATAAQKAANSLYIFKANILQDGTHKRAQALITGHIKEIDDGDWEAKKEIERKVTLSVASCALEIDGTQAVLIDADNLIYIVDGVDFLASARQNLQ